jgi:dipeptidase E
MRLYLSSYRLGDCADQLLVLTRGGTRACIISNALDNIPQKARMDYEATNYSPRRAFSEIGIQAVDLDLREYFGKREGLRERLAAVDLVWAVGGNSFLLLRAMEQSGFAPLIHAMLDQDEIVYGGFSAGAVVATPTLRGIDLMDSPSALADGYSSEVFWEGLGLVDFSIVPHYMSNHPEAPMAEKRWSISKRIICRSELCRTGTLLSGTTTN